MTIISKIIIWDLFSNFSLNLKTLQNKGNCAQWLPLVAQSIPIKTLRNFFSIANFEVFRWNILLSANLLFLKSVMLCCLKNIWKKFCRTSTGVSHHQWWTFELSSKRSKWPPNLKVLIEHICNQKRGQFIEDMWLPLARPSTQVQIVRKLIKTCLLNGFQLKDYFGSYLPFFKEGYPPSVLLRYLLTVG